MPFGQERKSIKRTSPVEEYSMSSQWLHVCMIENIPDMIDSRG